MDGRCATCRWWRTEETIHNPTGRAVPLGCWGYCDLATTNDGLIDSDVRAFALDAETYQANLITACDFGCTQWVSEVVR